jgi:hypothetical protein
MKNNQTEIQLAAFSKMTRIILNYRMGVLNKEIGFEYLDGGIREIS